MAQAIGFYARQFKRFPEHLWEKFLEKSELELGGLPSDPHGMEEKPLVLILCTGNSCRSQMAEAILRDVAGEMLQVASAGADPSGYVHPMALEVMAEIGLELKPDIYRSKHLDEFLPKEVETVVTVCGNADKECPTFPGQQFHYCWRFEDPAYVEGTEEEKLDCFRRVRDQIRLVFGAYGRGRIDQSALIVGSDRGESCC